MKKVIILLTAISLFAASCSEQKKKEKLESELKSKKEAFEKLRGEISALETELNAFDSSNTVSGKTVQLLTIVPTKFTHSIDIQGRVDAEESVSVGPQMPGLVKRVSVQPGDKVVAGQVLAELDADATIQQLASLKIQRDLYKQIYDRQQSLWDQKIGTEVQYLQAKGQYEAVDKQVAALQEQIDMARIKAPISGTVDNVGLKVGEMANPGFTTIVIVNTSKLRVKGEVAEGYISKVKTGCPVEIVLPDANKTINAKMTYAGRIINKLNRTFNVEVAIAPNEENVVPNMVAVLKINDHTADSAKVVPLACIQQGSDGKSFVYVAVKKGGKTIAERREVSYSISYNGMAEIETGLNYNDLVVTEGYADLNAGDEIAAQ